jgi:L-alanine-DL-glutamate epimerase-like enolase superfamily enzyme
MDPLRPKAINQFLLQSSRFPQGALGLAAIAAIDHALWDIAGKALNVPVYRRLGVVGPPRPHPPGRLDGVDVTRAYRLVW